MIAINMISDRALFFGPKSNFTEYLIPRVIGHRQGSSYSGTSQEKLTQHIKSVNGGAILPPLTPALLEKLLGKAPLRLIASRAKVENWFEEVLECGHSYTAFQNFLWDEGAHLINLEPSAKRRRCQECKVTAIASPKKPAQSVRIERKEKSA